MKTMQKTMSALLAVLLLVSAVTGCKAKEKTMRKMDFRLLCLKVSPKRTWRRLPTTMRAQTPC